MNEERCGGCEEQEIVTPRTIINRPGLHTLVYRVGTHASFMETMNYMNWYYRKLASKFNLS